MEVFERDDPRRNRVDQVVSITKAVLQTLADNSYSFDSVDDGSVARLTPHTSFTDPTTPPDAHLRESIELRALVFYD